MLPLTIAVDFDGTIVEHAFPLIGAPVPGAIETLLHWQAIGHRIILLTMRSFKDLEYDYLGPALKYLSDRGVKIWAANRNHGQDGWDWTCSQKVYADLYVDDAAAGARWCGPSGGGHTLTGLKCESWLLLAGVASLRLI